MIKQTTRNTGLNEMKYSGRFFVCAVVIHSMGSSEYNEIVSVHKEPFGYGGSSFKKNQDLFE